MALGILSGNTVGIEDRVTDVAPIDPTTGMSAYPWMAYSPRTRDLQTELSAFLQAHGYETVKADGKLGPGTCGFLRYAHDDPRLKFGWAAPDTCQSFGVPPKCVDASKCGPAQPVPPPPSLTYQKVPPVVVTPVGPVIVPEKPKTMSAAMTGGILAAIAVTGYAIAKKKGWIRG